jgi:hypothetical protein
VVFGIPNRGFPAGRWKLDACAPQNVNFAAPSISDRARMLGVPPKKAFVYDLSLCPLWFD